MNNKTLHHRQLFEDFDHYQKAYHAFSKTCSQRQISTSLADDHLISTLLSKLKPNVAENGENLRVLGVGSGTGYVDLQFIRKLMTSYPNIESTVVEPIPEYVQKYKQEVNKEEYSSIQWDWQQKTWQEYYETADLEKRKFHLILAIHAMYYFDDLEATVKELCNHLVNGGVLFMIVRADYPHDTKFVERFPMLGKNFFSEYNASNITTMLRQLHIKYDSIRREAFVDISNCFDKNNEEGQYLLDFIMKTVRFQDSFPVGIIQDVLQQFQTTEFSSKFDDKVMLRNDWEAIMVSK